MALQRYELNFPMMLMPPTSKGRLLWEPGWDVCQEEMYFIPGSVSVYMRSGTEHYPGRKQSRENIDILQNICFSPSK